MIFKDHFPDMLFAAVTCPDPSEILTGQLSGFLTWHRNRRTDGFSSPLRALWIDSSQPPLSLSQVYQEAGLSGVWTVYLLKDHAISHRDLMVALTEMTAESPGESGHFVPVFPHDLPPGELLRILSDLTEGRSGLGAGYMLQHRKTGRLLSSLEYEYPIRPIL